MCEYREGDPKYSVSSSDSQKEETKSSSDEITKARQCLFGIPQDVLFDHILFAIDHGAKTNDIRQNPMKYLTSGKTKEIVINSGGEGLKLSPEIIEEMSKRGDQLAKKIIDQNKFINYRQWGKISNLKFAFLEYSDRQYDRENKVLIQIIKEGKMKNTAGMTLKLIEVYEEPFMYRIENNPDTYGSKEEYVVGHYKVISEMKG